MADCAKDQSAKGSNCVACEAVRQCPDGVPPSSKVGRGLCTSGKGVGIRMYEGNGDNEGTAQERTDRCALACFYQRTALKYGPWSRRADAIGFGVRTNGRCYCQHEAFSGCKKQYTTTYTAYEFKAGWPCDATAKKACNDANKESCSPGSAKCGNCKSGFAKFNERCVGWFGRSPVS